MHAGARLAWPVRAGRRSRTQPQRGRSPARHRGLSSPWAQRRAWPTRCSPRLAGCRRGTSTPVFLRRAALHHARGRKATRYGYRRSCIHDRRRTAGAAHPGGRQPQPLRLGRKTITNNELTRWGFPSNLPLGAQAPRFRDSSITLVFSRAPQMSRQHRKQNRTIMHALQLHRHYRHCYPPVHFGQF